jgi:tryptophan 2,3-dioxygenase
MSLTYSDYLRAEELLSLQSPRSIGPEHDEMLFIIIHQVYELWFKVVLHEIEYLQQRLEVNDDSRALHTLRRILTIFKTLVAQLDILETMTPVEFDSFRDRLESASGFQSFQFREMEFILGHKRSNILAHFPSGSLARQRLDRRYHQPTLWDAFLTYLAQNGHPIPAEELERDVTLPIAPSPVVQSILVDIYRRHTHTNRICERLVDLDEALQEWRYRHVIMVQRTIGTKKGTGGSSGTEYLTTTLFKPLFPDLWAVRAEL